MKDEEESVGGADGAHISPTFPRPFVLHERTKGDTKSVFFQTASP